MSDINKGYLAYTGGNCTGFELPEWWLLDTSLIIHYIVTVLKLFDWYLLGNDVHAFRFEKLFRCGKVWWFMKKPFQNQRSWLVEISKGAFRSITLKKLSLKARWQVVNNCSFRYVGETKQTKFWRIKITYKMLSRRITLTPSIIVMIRFQLKITQTRKHKADPMHPITPETSNYNPKIKSENVKKTSL